MRIKEANINKALRKGLVHRKSFIIVVVVIPYLKAGPMTTKRRKNEEGRSNMFTQ